MEKRPVIPAFAPYAVQMMVLGYLHDTSQCVNYDEKNKWVRIRVRDLTQVEQAYNEIFKVYRQWESTIGSSPYESSFTRLLFLDELGERFLAIVENST